MVQAGVYAGMMHYLKALDAPAAIRMTAKIVDEDEGDADRRSAVRQGHDPAERPQDPPAYLFEVKKPAESKGPWDFYKLVGTVPGEQAFTPLPRATARW